MSENNQNQQTNEQNQQSGNNQNQPAFDYDKLAEIINGKQSVAEDTVLKNYFKNQGLSSDEMKQAIAAYKEKKAKDTPDVGQLQTSLSTAQSDLMKERINTAAMKEALKQGVPLASVDYLLRMADLSKVTGEDGKISDDALTAAVKKVLDDVPALKGSAGDSKKGFDKIGGDGKDSENNDETMKVYRTALGLKNK